MRTGLVRPKVKESTTTSSDGRLDMVIAFDTTSSKISHIVKAAAMARRVSRPKLAYKTTMDSFVNDAEMPAVYTAYSKEVIS